MVALCVVAASVGCAGCGVNLPNNLRQDQIKQQQQTNRLLRQLIVIERRQERWK